MRYNTKTFIDRVAVKAAIPIGQTTYTEAELLDLANQELQSTILPEILRTREDYYLTQQQISVKAGQESIPMPERAVAGKINDVQIVESNERRSIPRITTSEITGTQEGSPESFYFRGPYLGLNPIPSRDIEIIVSYYSRPSALIIPEYGYTLLDIVVDSSGEPYYNVDSKVTNLHDNEKVDFINSSGLHHTLYQDIEIDYIDEGTRVYLIDPPANIPIGSIMVPAGQSPFIQCPQELYPWLEELVVVKIHESNGDFQAMKLAQEKANLIREQILSLLSPRAETESQIITNTIWRYF